VYRVAVMTDEPNDILNILKRYWGFDTLLPLQAEAIEAERTHRDSLVVLPTGGGKSLCYQIPPLLEEGRIDLVVSPLIALMKDQVDGLRQQGYPAAAMHSALSLQERDDVQEGLRNRRYRLLFVSPERLVTPVMQEIIEACGVRAFAIDEAHCISQWGHDFRPEYRQLATLRERFPQASVHAYTATATPRVREDICAQLGLREPQVLVGTFDRPNLVYRVLPAGRVHEQVREVLRRHSGEAAIVYCLSRNDTDNLAGFLTAAGMRAAPYHAGLDASARTHVQDAFAAERIDVVVATVAFGMGIDRSNVRCVIHSSLPKSVEAYQQETGRAGRDGLEAECVLLYTYGDAKRWERLIEQSAQRAPDPDAIIATGMELLEQMTRFCTSGGCRHRALSRYFGQEYDNENCEACDICLGEVEMLEGSQETAQKILSCVYRMGQRFGVGAVVEVLRGSCAAHVLSRGHDKLSTHGLLRELTDSVVRHLVYQLIEQGYLVQTPGDRPVVQLTGLAPAVLRGEQSVRLIDPGHMQVQETRVLGDQWEGVDRDLFEVLRALRRELAEAQSVPAYVIFADTVLRNLAAQRPSTPDALRSVPGIGEKKQAAYGEAFVEAIRTHCVEHDLPMDVAGGVKAQGVPKPKVKVTGGVTASQAMELFKRGLSVEEVMAKTGRAKSTTWGYFGQFIEVNRPESIATWVDDETYRKVIQAVDESDEGRLKPIFERLEGNVPYEIIRAVLVHQANGVTNRSGDDP